MAAAPAQLQACWRDRSPEPFKRKGVTHARMTIQDTLSRLPAHLGSHGRQPDTDPRALMLTRRGNAKRHPEMQNDTKTRFVLVFTRPGPEKIFRSGRNFSKKASKRAPHGLL